MKLWDILVWPWSTSGADTCNFLCGYHQRLLQDRRFISQCICLICLHFPGHFCLPGAAMCGYRCKSCGYHSFLVQLSIVYLLLFLFTESAPLQIRGLTPGFVQAAIDHLNTSDLYTTKLLCGRYEPPPPDEQQPGSSEPSHQTRSSEKKKPDLIKEAMGFSSDIRGKMPKPFSSKAEAEAEASRGAAMDFSLSNTHQLAMLTNYLYLNGKYDLCSTPKDGSCLFSACKWGADFPVEYVNLLFRRDLVCFIAENADFFLPEMEDHIKGCYGGIRLSKEEYEQKKKAKTLTKSEEEEYHYPGPFSFKKYLEYILKDTTWGEELLIVAMSQRWQLAITVVHGESLRESRVRHNRPLDEVDLVLVYCGNNHYVGASKYHLFAVFLLVGVSMCVCAAHADNTISCVATGQTCADTVS